jgi:hypothetical protein
MRSDEPSPFVMVRLLEHCGVSHHAACLGLLGPGTGGESHDAPPLILELDWWRVARSRVAMGLRLVAHCATRGQCLWARDWWCIAWCDDTGSGAPEQLGTCCESPPFLRLVAHHNERHHHPLNSWFGTGGASGDVTSPCELGFGGAQRDAPPLFTGLGLTRGVAHPMTHNHSSWAWC